jgi:hypothetical protein
MKIFGIVLSLTVIAFGGIIACSSSDSYIVQAPKVQVPDEPFTHDRFNTVLNTYVDDAGMVNYKGLKENRTPLDQYVAHMGAVANETYKAWSKDEQMAFWINAYNAITLQSIINHYPIKKGNVLNRSLYPDNSIRQISGVWDKLETKVMGKPMTLNAIEHEVLRVDFKEPRIHVAIVCASIGCPPLRNEAFVADKLEEQLSDQSKDFANHRQNLTINSAEKTIYLSSILDWFGEDFEGSYSVEGRSGTESAIVGFVHEYALDAQKAELSDASYSLEFQDYDWNLNEQP